MSLATPEKISLQTAIIIGVNSIVGAGIFASTSLLGSKIGPAGILTYIISFVAIWFIAQSFARVAYLFPQQGSFYNYTKQWAGHNIGLLSGCVYLLGLLTAASVLTKILCVYSQSILMHYDVYISRMHLGIGVIALITALNLAGAKLSTYGQYFLIACTIYPLALTTILCLLHFDFSNLTPFMPNGIGSIFAGTKIAVFGLFGFEAIASFFNIIENPEKNIPLALKRSLAFVGVLYLVFIGSILMGVPQQVFHDHTNITIPQALQILYPDYSALIQSIAISIMFSILGTVHALMWASSELLLSFFGLLKSACMQKIYNGYKRSMKKVAVLAVSAYVLTVFLTIDNTVLFCITDVCVLFAFITSIMSLLFIKKEWQSGQNYITIIGLIAALIIFSIALQTMVHEFIMWLE